MGFTNMLAVFLQGGKAHLTLPAVKGIFNVCCPETQQKPVRAKKSREKKRRMKREIYRGRKKKGKKMLLPR